MKFVMGLFAPNPKPISFTAKEIGERKAFAPVTISVILTCSDYKFIWSRPRQLAPFVKVGLRQALTNTIGAS